MKNGNMPVAPIFNEHGFPTDADHAEVNSAECMGLTKREYFAGLAMQGLLASGPHDCDLRGIAYDAVCAADALLKALEES
jgi:hypothetical protein